MNKFKIFLLFFFFPFFLYGEEEKLFIVYTGNTYASLYPCGKCPATVGGGVSRRAKVLKEILKEEKNFLILEAGNFFGGGNFDENSIGPNLDKKRTNFYLKALEAMHYEVLGIGEGEFNFGLDYLKERIKETKIKFVASNLNLEGVLPYYIKEINQLKIAFLVLVPQSVVKKVDLEVENYNLALTKIFEKIKKEKEVDLFILVSPLNDEENKKLLKDFPWLNIIISTDMFGKNFLQIEENKFIVKPFFEGKVLTYLILKIENKKIKEVKLEEKKLSLEIKEDEGLKKMIPVCFKENDCVKKEGLISECKNQGEQGAVCIYYEAKKINALVITDKNCPYCDITFTFNYLKENFSGLNFEILHYEDKKAQDLIKSYKLTTLPVFILPLEIKEERNFSKIIDLVEEKENKIFLKKGLTGIFMFLEREKIPNKLDLFLDLSTKEAKEIFSRIYPIALKNKLILEVHFISPIEDKRLEEEVKIFLAIKKNYPGKFLLYLDQRLKNLESLYWIDDLERLKIDYKEVKKFLQSKAFSDYLEKEIEFLNGLSINEGNVILINNQNIFRIFNLKEEDLKYFLRR